MRSLIIYYLSISLPLLALVYLVDVPSDLFVICLVIYALIFRPIVDLWRLISVMPDLHRKQLVLFLVPFYGHFRYFRQLYLPQTAQRKRFLKA